MGLGLLSHIRYGFWLRIPSSALAAVGLLTVVLKVGLLKVGLLKVGLVKVGLLVVTAAPGEVKPASSLIGVSVWQCLSNLTAIIGCSVWVSFEAD